MDTLNGTDKPDAVNFAMTLEFRVGREWRGVGDPWR
jgi:hypothetical protein